MSRKRSRESVQKLPDTSEKYESKMPARREGEPFVNYYERMSRSANQRLRSLEKLAQTDDHFKGVLKYAYANAMYDIKHITKSADKNRFPISVPKSKDGELNIMEMHRRLSAVKRFWESPTSTKTGIKEVFQRRADTVNKRIAKGDYGTAMEGNLTWEDLARFYESDIADKIKSNYGSDTIIMALATIKNASRKPEQLQDAIDKNIKLSENQNVQKIIDDMLVSMPDVENPEPEPEPEKPVKKKHKKNISKKGKGKKKKRR